MTASYVQAARALALDEAAVATIGVLEAAGIDVLLIKGPVSAARLYAEAPDARNYCDVDLLVAPDRFALAQGALARAGYRSASLGLRPSELNEREVTWFCPGETNLAIDLHRSLAWVGDPSALWSRLWRDRTTMALQGHDVPVPDIAGTALIVALHASRAGSSRQPFRDLARAVAVLDDNAWLRAIEIAREADALTGFALGLDSGPESRPLLTRFALPTNAPTAMRVYAFGASPASVSLARLIGARGQRARHFASRVFPTAAFMHKAWPASKSGRVALVRAHGQRWRRFAGTVPRGVVELRQAGHGGPAGRDGWTADALAFVRSQLAETGSVQLPPFRRPRRGVTERSVDIVLQRNEATCLERSLVRQLFYSARGRDLELRVGVSPPSAGFRAHAWLSSDSEDSTDGFQVIHRVRQDAHNAPVIPFRLAALRYRDNYTPRHQERESDHG